MKEEEILDRCIRAYDTLTDETRFAIYHGIELQGDDYKLASAVMPMIGSHPTHAATALKMQWRKHRYVGIVALIDGWTYPEDLLDQTAGMSYEELEAWTEKVGRAADHPRRREVTAAHMMFKSGTAYYVSQIRNQPETRTSLSQEMLGRIPKMLEYILSY